MRLKDFAIKTMDEGGSGGFVGYASTFDREPDSYGDVIAKGAFADTLAAWAASGRPIPLLYGHNMDDPDYNIGVVEAEEDERGLLVHASYDESPKAQRVRELVREGRLGKMSFAFDVLDEGTVTLEDGTKANELRKLDLYEVSVVLVPANSHAEIIDAKARAKYGATISRATGDELRSALASIEAIRGAADEAASTISALIGGDEPDEPGGEGDGNAEDPEPEGEDNAEDKSRELAARLRSLIG